MAITNDALIAELLTAATEVQRISDLADGLFVFNFLNPASRSSGEDGFLVAANSQSFPALLTGNGAMVLGVLGPCGLNPPHTHPRGTEIQLVIQGGPIETAFVTENGARLVKNTVPLGSATIFPKGSLHFQQSLSCEPTIFVSSFDFTDPGALSVVPELFSLDKGVVNATLGDIGVDVLDHLKIPAGVVLGAQSCLDRCHIDRSNFNFSSTFGDYIAFSNTTFKSAPPSSCPTTGTANSLAVNLDGLSPAVASFWQNPLHPTVIGLGAASGALLLLFLGTLFALFRQRRRQRAVSTTYPHPYPQAGMFPPMHGGARAYPYAAPSGDSFVAPSYADDVETPTSRGMEKH